MVARSLILGLCLLAASAFIAHATKAEPVPIRQSLAGFPMNVGAWKGQQGSEISDRELAMLGVDDFLNRIYYREGGARVSFYIGYHASQRQGSSIHSPLNCLPGSGWNPVQRSRLSIPVEMGEQRDLDGGAPKTGLVDVNHIFILRGLDKRLVLYWYQSQGRAIASEYTSRIYMVWDAMRTGRTDAALIRIMGSPFVEGDRQAEAAAESDAVEFARSVFPLLGQFLPQ